MSNADKRSIRIPLGPPTADPSTAPWCVVAHVEGRWVFQMRRG